MEWCLTFCREHQVEVFIPKRHMIAIAKRKEAFTQLGIKVLVEDDIELLENFNNKVKTAELFKDLPEICNVSPFEVVADVEAFKLSYEKLKQQLGKSAVLCVKYAVGEGASSFNIIEDGPVSIKQLEMSEKHLSYEAIIKILSSIESFKPLIITRMSGGIHYSYYAGINLPYLALKKLLGAVVEIPMYPLDVVEIVYVEQPVIL